MKSNDAYTSLRRGLSETGMTETGRGCISRIGYAIGMLILLSVWSLLMGTVLMAGIKTLHNELGLFSNELGFWESVLLAIWLFAFLVLLRVIFYAKND